MCSKTLFSARKSKNVGYDRSVGCGVPRMSRDWTETSRSDSGYGSGRRMTALTTLKTVVFPPMPSASVRMPSQRERRAIRRCGELLKTLQAGPQGGREKETV